MNSADKDAETVQRMLGLLHEIQKERTKLSSLDEFRKNSMKARAILFDFIQLGEWAGRLSSEFLIAHPNFPAHSVKGFRNVIAHNYVALSVTGIEDVLYQSVDQVEKELEEISKHQVG